jgi:S1-C subfamily serine protease
LPHEPSPTSQLFGCRHGTSGWPSDGDDRVVGRARRRTDRCALGPTAREPLRKPSTLGVNVVEPRTPTASLDVEKIANDLAPASSRSVLAGSRRSSGESIGTGLIVTSDGEIVTNAHVVGNAKTVHVRLNGESEPRDAAVVAADSCGIWPCCVSTPRA